MNIYKCYLRLTESEHFIVRDKIIQFIEEQGLNCNLYRYDQLEEGHVPLYREVVIVGDVSVKTVQEWLELNYGDFMEGNPHNG